MNYDPEYLNVQQLRERGWSLRLITQFLGAGEASTSPGYRAILEHIREQYPMLSVAVQVKLTQSTA